MRRFEYWFDDVLVDVPGCEPALALKHIRQAAIKFCEESKSLIVDLEAIDSVVGQADYTLVCPDGFEVVEIRTPVMYDGKELRATTRDELKDQYTNYLTEIDNPKYYFSERTDKISLCPKPSIAIDGVLTVKAAIRPTRQCAEVEDWFADTHFDAIASGAKAALMKMPQKPWTNLELYVDHRNAFSSAIHKARRIAATGGVRKPLRTKLW